MKMTLVSMLAVALLAGCICCFSLTRIERATVEIDGMRTEVLELIDADRTHEARDRLRGMAEAWSRWEQELAVLVPHDMLHEIAGLIIEGDANLGAGDLDDFNRSMAMLGEAIRHLYEEERPALNNIL